MRSAPSTSPGRGDVGAEVEQFVLDRAAAARRRRLGASAAIATPIAALASSTSPIAAMRRLDLLTRAAVDQPGAAAVAGARVDLVELDQRV